MNQSATEDLVTDTGNRDQLLAKYEIAILSVIFVLIVIGNLSLIIALILARIKIQRMYYFIFHLSLSDLITAFANVLPQLIWEVNSIFWGERFLCKFVKYIQLLGPYLSSYVLVVTAIDRYQAICFPLANSTWTERRAKIMISIAWLVALVCCLPQVFIFSYEHVAYTSFPNGSYIFKVLEPNNEKIEPELEPFTKTYYECWGTFIKHGEKIYVLFYATSVFFIPLIILVFTYFNICKVIWVNARTNNNSKNKKSNCKKTNTTSSTRTLIFHSKLAASLSRHKGDHNKDDTQEIDQDNFKNKLSNENAGILKFNSNQHQQIEEDKSLTISSKSSSEFIKKDCFRLPKNQQNGQTNNQMNNQNVNLQTTEDSKLITSNQMKTASIFASRTPAHTNKLSKAKIKTIKVTLVVIICYISCSLPFCSVQIWTHFFDIKNSSLWTGPLITITMLLPSLNSCVNPWIYLLLNRNLLYTLLKLLFGSKCIDNEYTRDKNQRLSISQHNRTDKLTTTEYASQPINSAQSTNNSPIQTPALINSSSLINNNNNNLDNFETLLHKNRLKQRKTSNQFNSIKNNCDKKIKNDKDKIDKNLNNNNDLNQNNNNLNNNKTKIRTVDTVASLNLLNKINIECLNNNSELNKFNNNLNRLNSETTNSLNLTTNKDQFIYNNKISLSAPDLKN